MPKRFKPTSRAAKRVSERRRQAKRRLFRQAQFYADAAVIDSYAQAGFIVPALPELGTVITPMNLTNQPRFGKSEWLKLQKKSYLRTNG